MRDTVKEVEKLIKEIWVECKSCSMSKEDAERLSKELDELKQNFYIMTLDHYKDKYQTVVWD